MRLRAVGQTFLSAGRQECLPHSQHVSGAFVYNEGERLTLNKERSMTTDWLIPALLFAGFVLLWALVLPRVKGGA